MRDFDLRQLESGWRSFPARSAHSVFSKILHNTIFVGLVGCVTIVSAGQATLQWTDNSSNESGFNVERSTDGVTWSVIATTAADVTEYVDQTVETDVLYSYRVNAFNEFGVSGYTNTADYLLANQAPTISVINDVTIAANSGSNSVAFSVADVDSALASLSLSAASGDVSLVQSSSIALSGSGADWTLSFSPATDASGTVDLTVIVSDGLKEASETFAVTITPPVVPTMSVASVTTNYNGLVPNGIPVDATLNSDNFDLIERVDYSVGGNLVASSTTAPFTGTLVFDQEGSYELVATASLYNSNITVSDSYSVSVAPEPIDPGLVNELQSNSIGTMTGSGSTTYSDIDDAYILTSDGGSWGGSADAFHFSSVQVMGDVTLTARLGALEGATGSAIAGVTLRSSDYADAAHVSVVIDQSNVLHLLQRAAAGEALSDTSLGTVSGSSVFVRLARVVDSVSVQTSMDGSTWQEVAQTTIHFGDLYLAGLEMADTSSSAVARIDRLSLTGTIVAWNDTRRPPSAPRSLLIGGLASQ